MKPVFNAEPANFTIGRENEGEAAAREALLDRAMGPGRRRKSSEQLRRGRRPAEGLAFAAHGTVGSIVGTLRLWNIDAGGKRALLLGPLAVEPGLNGAGIGTALIRLAIAEADRLGHGAILLVGDEPFYGRFGFSAALTTNLAMPGPYEINRFLALELETGYLDAAKGVIKANGRRDRRSVLPVLPRAA